MVDLIILPVKDASGQVMFLAPTGTDITDRKRAEDALKDANRRKDEFLATLAHELRNPLAPLRNGLQIIRLSGGDHAAVDQARAMMERQLGQLVHLVDDLLDLSRISLGLIVLRKDHVDLEEVVQQAVETNRPLMDSLAHTLRIELPPEKDIRRRRQYPAGAGNLQPAQQRRQVHRARRTHRRQRRTTRERRRGERPRYRLGHTGSHAAQSFRYFHTGGSVA